MASCFYVILYVDIALDTWDYPLGCYESYLSDERDYCGTKYLNDKTATWNSIKKIKGNDISRVSIDGRADTLWHHMMKYFKFLLKSMKLAISNIDYTRTTDSWKDDE